MADSAMNRGDIIWLALGGVAVVLVALGALFPSKVASLGDAVRVLRRSWAMRCVVLSFWGWLGWHLFVR